MLSLAILVAMAVAFVLAFIAGHYAGHTKGKDAGAATAWSVFLGVMVLFMFVLKTFN